MLWLTVWRVAHHLSALFMFVRGVLGRRLKMRLLARTRPSLEISTPRHSRRPLFCRLMTLLSNGAFFSQANNKVMMSIHQAGAKRLDPGRPWQLAQAPIQTSQTAQLFRLLYMPARLSGASPLKTANQASLLCSQAMKIWPARALHHCPWMLCSALKWSLQPSS